MKMIHTKNISYIATTAILASLLLSSTAFGAFEWKSVGGGKFVDGTTATDAVYTAGNVGIGIAAPTAKFQVVDAVNRTPDNNWNGQIKISGSGYAWYIALDGTAMRLGHTSWSRGLHFQTNEADRLNITAWGNVGIGTTAPSQRLHVNGHTVTSNLYMNDLYSPNNTRYTYISWGNSGSAGANILMYSWNHATASVRADMRFRTNGTNRVHIDGSTGNVGIATTAPSQKLHVIGNIRVSGIIQDNWGQTLRDAGGGWLRTYGSTGWYNGTYGGGWNMQDTTWVRSYANKAVYVNNTVRANTFEYNSDKNLKTNIHVLSNASDILNIEPKTFDWIDGENQKNSTNDIWVIAQDIEKYFPQFVSKDPETGVKAVDYPKLAVPLLGVVKQQQEQIDALTAEIAEIKELLK